MKSKSLIVLMLSMLAVAHALPPEENYYCILTYASNQRTITVLDQYGDPQSSGVGATRRWAGNVEDHQWPLPFGNMSGNIVQTYLENSLDSTTTGQAWWWAWSAYQLQPYAGRYVSMNGYLDYLTDVLECYWACPAPFYAIPSIVPYNEYVPWYAHAFTASTPSFYGDFSPPNL